jgi:hypothetical protein
MVYFLDCFRCKNCQREIVLPHSIRERIDTVQRDPSKESASLVLVCHVCGHGYEYSQSNFHLCSTDTPDPDSILGPDRPVVLSAKIECEEQSCKSPIEVYMPWAIASQTSMQGAQAAASLWILHDVKCPNGHRHRMPLRIVS